MCCQDNWLKVCLGGNQHRIMDFHKWIHNSICIYIDDTFATVHLRKVHLPLLRNKTAAQNICVLSLEVPGGHTRQGLYHWTANSNPQMKQYDESVSCKMIQSVLDFSASGRSIWIHTIHTMFRLVEPQCESICVFFNILFISWKFSFWSFSIVFF